jgi:hypothetical protein
VVASEVCHGWLHPMHLSQVLARGLKQLVSRINPNQFDQSQIPALTILGNPHSISSLSCNWLTNMSG